MPNAIICPSLLSGDFSFLANEAERMLGFGADWLHMDVMDGHFVPNLTIGAPVIKSLRAHTSAYLDCHLMVSHPEKWVDDFAKAGASSFTFHIETQAGMGVAKVLVERIQAAGMKAGFAIKPNTELTEEMLALAKYVDMVLVMTVEPGFGGQAFMEAPMTKVTELRKAYPDLMIQVDGGVGKSNIDTVAKAGANVIVAGSAIFGATDIAETISFLRNAVNQGSK